MNELKSEFQSSFYQEKIQILTLQPDFWTIEKISTFFDATKHAVKKAISLKKGEGILSMPKRAKRQGISDEDLQVVTNFFTSDEYSRQLPG